jgi:putative DNA primase/helicase
MSAAIHAFRTAVQAALGPAAVLPEVIEPGTMQRFSSSGKRGDTAGWLKVFPDMRGAVYGCHRAGISEQWCAVDRATLSPAQRAEHARQVLAATVEREAQQRQHWQDNARRIAQIQAQCVPLVAGDPVTLYLKGRGFRGVWPLPQVLRLHRGLTYWEGSREVGVFPAMVAAVTAPDGRVVALHRTYLTRAGRKAEVPTVKKLTGTAGPLAGACIALHKPARGVLGIAEGIETALAAWCASGVPTVAAYCAGNLAAWHWPGNVQRLVIFADADKAGREAADTLRARALQGGLRAEVLTPSTDGADWCDVWATRGLVEVAT